MHEYILNTPASAEVVPLSPVCNPALESKNESILILRSLVEGKHPFTGLPLPDESCYQSAKVLRALLSGVEALEKTAKIRKKILPAAAGKAWNAQEEERLVLAFESGTSIADLASKHQRTKNAIQSRLMKLGKMMSPEEHRLKPQ